MGALVFVYIIEEVAHAHAQNAPLEWLLSIPGLGVVPRPLSKICWLIDICGMSEGQAIVKTAKQSLSQNLETGCPKLAIV